MPKKEVRAGGFHEVKKGETLWRISQWYGVSVDELAKANNLDDAGIIKIGRQLFIPGARERIESAEAACEVDKDPFIWPAKGTIAEYFGTSDNDVANKGLDISAQFGGNVRASRSGRVAYCSDRIKGFGKTVILDHDDDFQTVYAHNSDILVAQGNRVRQNDIIARSGSRGGHTPLLHFEIRKRGVPRNPLFYLPER
ncbi:MAG: LysM peptidoglycan-binding domain-containing M23 family metallopeptidase [Candidatus Omnitrophota bacterium]